MEGSNLSVEQNVTEVPDDVWQLDYLFPTFLKLGRHTVGPADVPTHLQGSVVENRVGQRT